MTRIVDSDQHLYESRSLWLDHDYRRMGCEDRAMPALFHANIDALLNH